MRGSRGRGRPLSDKRSAAGLRNRQSGLWRMSGQMEGDALGRQLSRSRVWLLSQGRPNAFLAQKHCSEPLMIVEPEISFCRRDAAGADPRGAVISSADTERACGYDRHCNRNRDCSQLLDGWHDHLHPDPPYHLVLLIPNTGCELAHEEAKESEMPSGAWGRRGMRRASAAHRGAIRLAKTIGGAGSSHAASAPDSEAL